MGATKDEYEQTETRWNHLARSKGYRCTVCAQLIIYDEREVYFQSKMCGACWAGWEKMKEE